MAGGIAGTVAGCVTGSIAGSVAGTVAGSVTGGPSRGCWGISRCTPFAHHISGGNAILVNIGS